MDMQSAGDLETVPVTQLGPLVSIDNAPSLFVRQPPSLQAG